MQTVKPVVAVSITLRGSSGPSFRYIRTELINRFFSTGSRSITAYFNHFLHGEPLPFTIYKPRHSTRFHDHPEQSPVISRALGYSFTVNLDLDQLSYHQYNSKIQHRPRYRINRYDPRIRPTIDFLRVVCRPGYSRSPYAPVIAGVHGWAHHSNLVFMFDPAHPKAVFVMEYKRDQCVYLSVCALSALLGTGTPDHRDPEHPVYNVLKNMPIMDWPIVRQLTAEAERKDQRVPFIQSPLYDPNLWYDVAAYLAGDSRRIIVTSKSGKTYNGIEIMSGRLGGGDGDHGSEVWSYDIYMEGDFYVDRVPAEKTQHVDCRCPLHTNLLRADLPRTKKRISYKQLN